MPFTLEGKPSSKLAFERPRSVAGPENGYFLWRTPPTEPGQEIELDESIRERLRSLGYAD